MQNRMNPHPRRVTSILILAFVVLFIVISYCDLFRNSQDFRFLFMTDIHVQPESRAVEGFQAAIARANALNPDFIITGGDLIMDALEQNEARADSLYDLYTAQTQRFDMPVHNVLGNHEIFGLYPQSRVDRGHPEFGKQMFRNRLGEGRTYRSFDHKNWHFILLDGIGTTSDGKYIGEIDAEQLNWLQKDLESVGPHRPVVLALHIPLFTVAPQIASGPTAPVSPPTG